MSTPHILLAKIANVRKERFTQSSGGRGVKEVPPARHALPQQAGLKLGSDEIDTRLNPMYRLGFYDFIGIAI